LRFSELSFTPKHSAASGTYEFDVAETAQHGSAGSVSLILQTLLLPLVLAGGASTIRLRGGTHVPWSPPFDSVLSIYFPLLRRIGFRIDAELKRWGWYPAGGGEVVCSISAHQTDGVPFRPRPIEALGRGSLRRVTGRAVAANLPYHIPQRMADRARASLVDLGVSVDVEPQRVSAACPGAGIFLLAEYEGIGAGFSAYGRIGKSSEAVADEAVAALREHHMSGAAVEKHLSDQLLLPLAFASGISTFTVARPTGHLATNAWTIGEFEVANIAIEKGMPFRVSIEPVRTR
jgi:RNA 3'-terminal phosphate cyclase (ATP)